MPPVGRRALIRSAALGLTSVTVPFRWPLTAAADQVATGLRLGPLMPFSFAGLTQRARALAAAPYQSPPRPAPALVRQIDYATHGQLRFKPECALGASQAGAYPVTFFHLGEFFPKAVKMHVLVDDGAREIRYTPTLFDMPQDSVARRMPANSGFAGFRFQESNERSDWRTQDWLAFLGGSYFRAIGSLGQYGLSARGIAINTTAEVPEEFPDFVEFYLRLNREPAAPVEVFALLDGPSVSGAFRFKCQRGSGVVMEVGCQLFFRQAVPQLGVAPLTSMFWFGEYGKARRADWRPEVHDSDGLQLWTGAGQRLFRPLNAPSRVITSSFMDHNPRGFGLVQRDRCFEHYLDGVNYERRPSLWVEPLGSWGAGQVKLIEIPTHDEYHDNVVAFWCPQRAIERGTELGFRYRLYWQGAAPFAHPDLLKVQATRLGRVTGDDIPVDRITRFIVEFSGATPAMLQAQELPQARVSASEGTLQDTRVEVEPHGRYLRVQFDLDVDSGRTVELTLTLLSGQQPVSETWAYQFESS